MKQSSVVSNTQVENHTVESYRFKVIGTNLDEIPVNEAPQNSDESTSVDSKTIQNDEIVEVSKEEEKKLDDIQNSFIEELLKKTDELSSNMIKLQMQIESQEAEFQKRLETELERAKEDAKKQGFDEAKLEFDAKFKELNDKYLVSIQKLQNECEKIDKFIAKNENELSSAAIDIAKEVIQKEISANSALVAQNLAKSLMGELSEAKNIEIKVNPKDFEFIKESYKDDLRVKVSSDDAINVGGVILLSSVGNLDGSIENRMKNIKKMLNE